MRNCVKIYTQFTFYLYFDLFQHQNTSRRKSDFIKGFDFVVSNVRDRTDQKVMVMQATF